MINTAIETSTTISSINFFKGKNTDAETSKEKLFRFIFLNGKNTDSKTSRE
jgi:hypothetical protein